MLEFYYDDIIHGYSAKIHRIRDILQNCTIFGNLGEKGFFHVLLNALTVARSVPEAGFTLHAHALQEPHFTELRAASQAILCIQ